MADRSPAHALPERVWTKIFTGKTGSIHRITNIDQIYFKVLDEGDPAPAAAPTITSAIQIETNNTISLETEADIYAWATSANEHVVAIS